MSTTKTTVDFFLQAVKYYGWQGGTMTQVVEELEKRAIDMSKRFSPHFVSKLGGKQETVKVARRYILEDIIRTNI